jgi:hypothetical protein
MKKVLAAIAMCGLLVAPAFAVSDNVATAIKTIEQVGNDPAKLKTYCDMSKLMSSAEDIEDESKAEELDAKMDDYMKQLGDQFESAFEVGADLEPESEDGKAFDAAFDALDDKCGS